MDNLFTMPEKALLWDLIETHKISIAPRGWDHQDGFDASAFVQEGPNDYRSVGAHGATAKEAVEKLMQQLEEETNENQRRRSASA